MGRVRHKISNKGRIQHLGGKRSQSKIWPSTTPRGYKKFESKGGHFFVHLLVHVLFNDPELEQWEPGHTVDHIDRDKSNNEPSNLRWATVADQNKNKDSNAKFSGTKKRQVEPLCLEGEIWKNVPGTLAMVSNMGRVQCAPIGIGKVTVRYTPNPQPNGDGRCYVSIGRKTKQIGQWMLLAFDRPPSKGESCDHIDRDPANNHLSNLRWASRKEQSQNRNPYHNRHGSRTYEMRLIGTDDWFEVNTTEAVEIYGIRTGGDLSRAANPSMDMKSVVGSNGRYEVRFAETEDPDLEDEEWRDVDLDEWEGDGKYVCVRNKGKG